ncbi:hypothetical protein [Paraburkholderia caribensis]|uniref:hypothetical protein n=1 Tax=Paraburkholderia caribensis TaxID=75105 RepID=UPI001CB0F452|nr:hypothetical protein [Paraburkholderia caribensis]CAG9269498.1 conserved hypothetical protein [Paraburkholderia caribensis]
MSYADAIRPIRNRMRKFSYESVLTQISLYLQADEGEGEKHLRRLPWVAERLAIWALRDRPTMYGTQTMQSSDLNRCMNMAWHLMDNAIEWHREGDPIDLFMRSMLLSQTPHQSAAAIGAFARQIDLLNRLDPASRLRRAIDAALGMDAYTYLQLAVFFWLRDGNKMNEVFLPAYWSALQLGFGEAQIRSLLQTMFVPYERVCQEIEPVDEDEWFQPTLLYRFPFVVHNRKLHFFGMPSLRRHFEYAFSDIVVRLEEPKVRQPFEDAFEDYVGDSLKRTGLRVLRENEVRREFGVEGPCCDFAVIDGDCIVLLEAKNKALAHTFPASATVRTYRSKLSATLVKAASQLHNVASHVVRSTMTKSLKVHKVIVTYGDLMFGSGRCLFEGTTEDQNPLIFGADQLDRLLEAVRLGQCSLSDFFDDYRGRQADPARRFFSPAQLLEHPPYQLTAPPQHLADVFNPFFDDMTRRLTGSDEIGENRIRIGAEQISWHARQWIGPAGQA